MAQGYSEFLAANVLNEQQHVSYRNLSRALKVHSNLAKQMLYEFHRKQNSKKPGSVHATYIVTGTKHAIQTNGVHSQEDGEDSIMHSSPPIPGSSLPEQDGNGQESVPVKSIMLVREGDLDKAKALFERITGMHIYSLQANPVKDIQVLTECNRRVAADYATEDPLKEWNQYGTIQNSHVRRRTGKRGPPLAAPPVAKPEPVKAKAVATAATKSAAAELKGDSKASSKEATPEPSKTTATKPTAMKKQNSNLFKSFAKSAPPKPKRTDSEQSSAAGSTVPAAEDVPMTGFSDDDLDDDKDTGSGLPEVEATAGGKSRSDRKAELEAMMDAEDEPMEDVADSPAAEDAGEHDEGAIDKTAPEEKEEPKENVVVENGRRRGRRRVMKKKTVKDEDGYLVTREEPAWEEFSEDEPAPKKPKVQAPANNKPAPGKKAGKPGQGNIMSFFSKK